MARQCYRMGMRDYLELEINAFLTEETKKDSERGHGGQSYLIGCRGSRTRLLLADTNSPATTKTCLGREENQRQAVQYHIQPIMTRRYV